MCKMCCAVCSVQYSIGTESHRDEKQESNKTNRKEKRRGKKKKRKEKGSEANRSSMLKSTGYYIDRCVFPAAEAPDLKITIVKRLPPVLSPHRVQDLRRIHSAICSRVSRRDMSRVRRECRRQVHAGRVGLREWDAVVHRVGLGFVGVVSIVRRLRHAHRVQRGNLACMRLHR